MIQKPCYLFVFLLVLSAGYATPVWGECAWVLWEETQILDLTGMRKLEDITRGRIPGPQGWWRVVSAVNTRTQCEAELQRALKERMESLNHMKKLPEFETTHIIPGPDYIRMVRLPSAGDSKIEWRDFMFRCLPDTIDPRSRK